jgi:RHS repeat-associated protein
VTGLDYFGARYYGAAQGRFTTPDPKEFTRRTIENPQKWNKYAYVRNNPLALIDPNGLDDIYVFRPEATSLSTAWQSVMRSAQQHGNRVIPMLGTKADSVAYTNALSTPGAHVVFAGHSVEAVQSDATETITKVAGSVHLPDHDVGTMTSTGLLPAQPGNVAASSVALFGCNTVDLVSQYAATTFTGMASGSDFGTTLVALGSAALAYTSVLADGGTVEQAAKAAGTRVVASPDRQDHNGDRVVIIPKKTPEEEKND